MTRSTITPMLILLLAAVWIGSGCDSEGGVALTNLEPNTRISASPPEGTDTGFNVDIFWFGWDDDGFVDYYQVAWESTTVWSAPVFSNDSLFTLSASDSCCVSPLPDFGPNPTEAIFQGYHTFYVRAVDDNGDPDPTPAAVSFNSKTIAPSVTIGRGPGHNGVWATRVPFGWDAEDPDGIVVGAYYTLLSFHEYAYQHDGQPPSGEDELIAWIDTLSYRPLPGGGQATEPLWIYTSVDTTIFPELPVLSVGDRYVFAVRGVDNAGAVEQVLTLNDNVRAFSTSELQDGPKITITSNIAGTWRSGTPAEVREIFAGQGLRFSWRATPRGSDKPPVAGYSYAVDDTARWSPWSITSVRWPEQIPDRPPELWFPGTGPHKFFVRSIDEAGFIGTLVADLQVYPGPRFCPPAEQTILIVLDTSTNAVQVLPIDYPRIERGLVSYWFDGYDYQVFETGGNDRPDVSLLDCATSVIWFHSADLDGSDPSVLDSYHAEPPNTLPSYVSAGGNLAILGIQPGRAMRYFERADTTNAPDQQIGYLLEFFRTVNDSSYVPHWMYTMFGVSQIENSVGDTQPGSQASRRLNFCRSQVRVGSNPYPDLYFDPLTWPNGPNQGGFGYYDVGFGLVGAAGGDTLGAVTEIIYTRNGNEENAGSDLESEAIGIRRLTTPGINGNLVFLGFHPYFVERPLFRQLVQAILTDFGESPESP